MDTRLKTEGNKKQHINALKNVFRINEFLYIAFPTFPACVSTAYPYRMPCVPSLSNVLSVYINAGTASELMISLIRCFDSRSWVTFKHFYNGLVAYWYRMAFCCFLLATSKWSVLVGGYGKFQNIVEQFRIF